MAKMLEISMMLSIVKRKKAVAGVYGSRLPT
ncbi:Uncharacterised protein [Vibrio cholerae]|nr:Uncharacterised protein [Vibrio cholerae]CSI24993.1 Uncharacterised protein [Vibrio cholerae]